MAKLLKIDHRIASLAQANIKNPRNVGDKINKVIGDIGKGIGDLGKGIKNLFGKKNK